MWVSVTLHPNINLTHKYRISCHNIKVKEQDVEMQSVRPLAFLRAGVAMRKNNQDNIHTSRIPGIATSKIRLFLPFTMLDMNLLGIYKGTLILL